MPETKKRETAYKLRISDILRANPVFEEIEDKNKRLKFVSLGNKNIVRVNIIANIIDKYESEGEKRFGSITLDDGSGQIRGRLFGEDINKFSKFSQGDTVVVIGLLRFFNNEIYIIPDLIKSQDPRYLLIRKLEIEKEYPKLSYHDFKEKKQEIKALRDEVINLIREAESKEGIDKDEIILKIKAPPELISQEIQKVLEEGVAYEPKPGRVRYLG